MRKLRSEGMHAWGRKFKIAVCRVLESKKLRALALVVEVGLATALVCVTIQSNGISGRLASLEEARGEHGVRVLSFEGFSSPSGGIWDLVAEVLVMNSGLASTGFQGFYLDFYFDCEPSYDNNKTESRTLRIFWQTINEDSDKVAESGGLLTIRARATAPGVVQLVPRFRNATVEVTPISVLEGSIPPLIVDYKAYNKIALKTIWSQHGLETEMGPDGLWRVEEPPKHWGLLYDHDSPMCWSVPPDGGEEPGGAR